MPSSVFDGWYLAQSFRVFQKSDTVYWRIDRSTSNEQTSKLLQDFDDFLLLDQVCCAQTFVPDYLDCKGAPKTRSNPLSQALP